MEFAFIENDFEHNLLEDAYKTIINLDMWDWLANYVPHPEKGFMFSTDPNIFLILNSMAIGASFVCVQWNLFQKTRQI